MHKIRDRFIDSVKGNEEQVTDGGIPVGRTRFTRYFFNALFSVNDEEEINRNKKLTPEDKRMEIVVPSQSRTTATDDDQMLKEVKELPPESKISVLLSIIYGLIGIDAATSEGLSKMSKDTETCRGGRPVGVENRGLDCYETELRSSQPDPIADTRTDREIFPENASPDSQTNCFVKINSKTSVVSGDPESGVSVPPEPKTVRAWLKDPRLYKVSSFCLCRIYECLTTKTDLFEAKIVVVFSLRRWLRSTHLQRMYNMFHTHICPYFLFTKFSLRRYLNISLNHARIP